MFTCRPAIPNFVKNALFLLQKNIQPADITLSIIVGDWNFTVHSHDRITKKDATWTGDSQSKEAGIFTKQVLTTHNFHEIFQPLHTHEDGLVRSRLDRVYINHHPTDFLDKDIRAWVHSFPYEISHHRTLLFCRRSKPKRTKALGVCPPLPLAGVNHQDFRNKVEKKWQDNRDRLICLTPLQQLGEFKKVMRRAAYELADRRDNLQPTLHEDRLNACMRLIRAMEGKDRVTCNKILSSNTELAALAAGKTEKPLLDALRKLAWELFQKETQDKIDELRAVKDNLAEEENRRRKDTILRRMQLSLPLNREVKLVVQAHDGNIETNPKDMARALGDHWKKVFSARPTTDGATLRKWLTEHPYGIPTMLRKDTKAWLLTQQHVEVAIKQSNNSSPGPDGIPYAAWRKWDISRLLYSMKLLVKYRRRISLMKSYPMALTPLSSAVFLKSPLALTLQLATTMRLPLPDLFPWSTRITDLLPAPSESFWNLLLNL